MTAAKRRQSDEKFNLSADLSISRVAFLDDFLPPDIANDHDKIYRGRILVGLTLSYALFLCLGALYFHFFTPLSDQIKLQTAVALLPLAVMFICLLYVFKYTGAFHTCANILVCCIYLGVTIGIFVSAGPINSPAVAVVPVPALLAFCMCGRFWGFFWATVICLTHLLMFAMASSGYEYMNLLENESSNINTIFDWIIAYSAIITTVALYEHMQMLLKKERDLEHKKYVHLATHDQLTNLPNRVLFYDRIQRAVSRANREHTHFGLLYLDLDGFKPINDMLGHNAGDVVLQETADRLSTCIRETDTVARVGGDEFAVILENLSDNTIANDIAQKIAFQIGKPIFLANHKTKVKASIGIAFYPVDGTTSDELIRCADVAMYHAKSNTEHCISYQQALSHSPELAN